MGTGKGRLNIDCRNDWNLNIYRMACVINNNNIFEIRIH